MTHKRRAVGQDHGTDLREADPLQGKGEPIREQEESLRLQLGRSKRQELPHQVAQTQNLAQITSAENVQKATNATFGIHQSVNAMPVGIVVKVTNVPSYIRNQRLQRRRRRLQLQNPKLEPERGQAARSGQSLPLSLRASDFYKRSVTTRRKRRRTLKKKGGDSGP